MTPRRAWPLVAFAAFLAASSLAPPSGADGGGTFSAVASSSGLRLSLTAPGYAAVQELTDFGFPVAQATVDSLGESSGFASYPYPGGTFLAGPGTLAGFAGQGLPAFLTYPFIVSSSYPGQPESKANQPGYQLASTSNASSSEATAEAGGASQGMALGFTSAAARARRKADDDSVVAEATNRTDGLALADTLRIGHAAGAAKVGRTGGGPLTRESSFVLEGVSVAGQAVGLAPDGFVVPGTTVPAPNAAALTEALARAGITVRYLRGGELADGVVSPGMAVNWTQQIPNGPLLVMTLTFGQAVARVSSDAGGSVAADVPASLTEASSGPASDASSAPSPTEPIPFDTTAPAAAAEPIAFAEPDTTALGPPAGEPLAAPPQVAAPAAPVAVLAPAARAGTVRLEPTVNTFYSVLLFAALAGVLATIALRRAGN